MSTYDQRMEDSEKKLHDRLEDFEAERRDAELAFKVSPLIVTWTIKHAHIITYHSYFNL